MGALTSQDGNFVVDFPGKPTKNFTRQARSRTGQVKIVIVQCDTPDVSTPPRRSSCPESAGLKPADMEAILDYWSDDLANDFNGKIVAQKKLRLDRGPTAATSRSRAGPTPRRAWPRSACANSSRRRCSTSWSPRPPRTGSCPTTSATSSPRSARERSGPSRSAPIPSPRASRWAIGARRSTPTTTARSTIRARRWRSRSRTPYHDLNADNDKLNSPRVLREVTGDFTITVKVSGRFKPSHKSTNPKAVPYIGAGIVVWQDSNNYVFLGRAASTAAEDQRVRGLRGTRVGHPRRAQQQGIEPGGVYLRLERRNNRLLGYTSKDGKSWTKLDPMEPSYPATLKVGLYAINGCTGPIKGCASIITNSPKEARPPRPPPGQSSRRLFTRLRRRDGRRKAAESFARSRRRKAVGSR